MSRIVEVAARTHGMAVADYRQEVDPLLLMLFESWPARAPEVVQQRAIELAYAALGTASETHEVVFARVQRLWAWVVHVYVPTWLDAAGDESRVYVPDVLEDEVVWLEALRRVTLRAADVTYEDSVEVGGEDTEEARETATGQAQRQGAWTAMLKDALAFGANIHALPMRVEVVEGIAESVWDVVLVASLRGTWVRDPRAVLAGQVEALLRLLEELVAMEAP